MRPLPAGLSWVRTEPSSTCWLSCSSSSCALSSAALSTTGEKAEEEALPEGATLTSVAEASAAMRATAPAAETELIFDVAKEGGRSVWQGVCSSDKRDPTRVRRQRRRTPTHGSGPGTLGVLDESRSVRRTLEVDRARTDGPRMIGGKREVVVVVVVVVVGSDEGEDGVGDGKGGREAQGLGMTRASGGGESLFLDRPDLPSEHEKREGIAAMQSIYSPNAHSQLSAWPSKVDAALQRARISKQAMQHTILLLPARVSTVSPLASCHPRASLSPRSCF
ncbi:hypothetical protein L1887_55096 [Cichorium endivia]|nr:hypothetical protein L1887_55096 [Cichorium endivia]